MRGAKEEKGSKEHVVWGRLSRRESGGGGILGRKGKWKWNVDGIRTAHPTNYVPNLVREREVDEEKTGGTANQEREEGRAIKQVLCHIHVKKTSGRIGEGPREGWKKKKVMRRVDEDRRYRRAMYRGASGGGKRGGKTGEAYFD